jgi:hypothetical protein
MPDRSYWATSLGTVVLSGIIALCGTYLYIQTVDTLPPLWFDRDTMGEVWPVELVLSGLFGGVGIGLLFSGAIQTDLSDRLGAASGVTGAVAVSGFPLVASTILEQYAWQLDLLSLTALVTVDNFLLVVYALGLTQGIWIVTRRAGVELTPVRGTTAVVIVTALVTLAIADQTRVPQILARAAVAGLVAVEYERSQSVWVPMAAYSSFEVFGAVETAQFLLG